MKFELSKKEELAAEEFKKEHRHKDVYKGAIGGHIEYRFVQTSIGDFVSIHCSICNTEKNITDYDNI